MTNVISIVFYISCYIIASLGTSIGFKYKNKWLIIVSVLIPIVIATFRYNVGTDFNTYYNMYLKYGSLNLRQFIDANSRYYEIFNFIAIKIAYTFKNFNVYLFIYAFLINLFYLRGLYNYSKKLDFEIEFLHYYLFLLTIFTSSFNIMRQGLAVVIIFYAFSHYFENKKLTYLNIILASMIHVTSLIIIPVVLMMLIVQTLKKRLTYSRAIYIYIYILLFIFIVFLISNILYLDQYNNYVNLTSSSLESNKIFYLELLKLFVVLLFYKKYSNLNTKYALIICLYSLSSIALGLGFINIYLKRIAIYFKTFELILIPSLSSLFINNEEKMIVKLLVFVYYTSLFIYIVFYLSQMDILPYEFKILN